MQWGVGDCHKCHSYTAVTGLLSLRMRLLLYVLLLFMRTATRLATPVAFWSVAHAPFLHNSRYCALRHLLILPVSDVLLERTKGRLLADQRQLIARLPAAVAVHTQPFWSARLFDCAYRKTYRSSGRRLRMYTSATSSRAPAGAAAAGACPHTTALTDRHVCTSA
jgi:hypothetical protein